MGLVNRFNAVSARLAPVRRAACVASAPMLSICFDDFPKSAWTVGGPILAAHGVKATYYVSGRFCGAAEDGLRYYDRDDLAAVTGAGHEIGCHTFSHQKSTEMSREAFEADRARNRRFLAEAVPGVAIESFAYPYGAVSVRAKKGVGLSCATARGIRPDVNGDPLDLALLAAAPLERRSWSEVAMERLMRRAAAGHGWLILFTHDVAARPSPYGRTPAMLELVLSAASRHGLTVLPVGAAARRRVGPELAPSLNSL